MRRDSFTLAKPITFGSVCSGLEAASVAWHPLGWRAAWLAEIEPFPCAVLAHHYPDVPNLGDMTKVAALVRDGFVPAPDVFCGGTPCQAFSIAGLRNSLDDARGNLSLVFCEIADEIDARRAAAGLLPAVVFWENVPGVLSTKDNAFGCLLAGLAGEDDPIEPPGGKWAHAGCVYGPARTVAWRTLDAQYFGVAQRRRRVFVIASAGESFDPAQVLFEFDGVRRDSPPSRQTGQEVAGTISSRTTGGGGLGTDFELGGGLQPVGAEGIGGARQNDGQDPAFGAAVAAPVARSVDRPHGDCLDTLIAGTLQANGKASGSATQQDAEAGMLIPIAFSMKDYGGDAALDLAPTLRAGNHNASHANGGQPPAIAFDARQDCVSSNEVFGALGGSSPQAQAVCQTIGSREVAGALTSSYGKQPDGSDSALGPNLAVCITGDVTHTLKAEGFDASEDETGRGQPIVTFQNRFRGDDGRGYQRAPAVCQDVIGTLETVKQWNLATGMAVRRLTPRECERLQDFPDDYTLIPFGRTIRPEKLDQDWVKYLLRGGVMTRDQVARAAADGPRYKAIGNSWAVSNVAWLGRRIDAAMRANFAHEREIARVA